VRPCDHNLPRLDGSTSSNFELHAALIGARLGVVGSSEFIGYCSFTKAIEHLGDRWALFILRELSVFGPQGFNDLATGLPGRISRSVLADRLRKLENLGLVAHAGGAPYRLTAPGTGLVPTILSLRGWAEMWLPDDPDMVERDPDVVLAWLARRTAPGRLPHRPVVMEFTTHHRHERRWWLVLQRGAEPYGCLRDPLLDETRYVYVRAAITTLLALGRGRRDWAEAIDDGTLVISGAPELASRVTEWFTRAAAGASAR
jgi:DNA-binding HxlR family transcriptional regulator